ncbi:hypothetical protein CLAIMM_05934 isoform 2 [Cladophialophora immunda]|nr:hypothetical protein CLAIMM_05934 isoform 1 [Cladophialophora immunda]OQV00442.1 hypothetical protein CLAIMM_05934 isoform 2 [Cladophialophora immunda]
MRRPSEAVLSSCPRASRAKKILYKIGTLHKPRKPRRATAPAVTIHSRVVSRMPYCIRWQGPSEIKQGSRDRRDPAWLRNELVKGSGSNSSWLSLAVSPGSSLNSKADAIRREA